MGSRSIAEAIPEPLAVNLGTVAVRVPRIQLFRDSLSEHNETAVTWQLDAGFALRHRPRTPEDVAAGIADGAVVDAVDGETDYIGMKGEPLPAPPEVTREEFAGGDGFFQTGSSSLQDRNTRKVDWSKASGPTKRDNSHAARGRGFVLHNRNSGVMRADGTVQD